MANKKKILFAVLNWGLGHATRSWELINNLIREGHDVVIASDGEALEFLQLEFPNQEFHELPSYNAQYGSSGGLLPMLSNAIKTQQAVKKENQWLKSFLQKNSIDQIISDNRYGIYDRSIESTIITHQLNIKAPFGSTIVNIQNHKWLNKFDEIWVPDQEGELSGKLSTPIPEKLRSKVQEIGFLSRFKNKVIKPKENKVVAVVSGPEPQKTILFEKLKSILSQYEGESILYGGSPGGLAKERIGSLTIKSHAGTDDFFNDLASAKLVIGRSGYSSLLDDKVLNKRLVLIPPPGQDEQIYLGNYLSNNDEVTLILQKDLNFASVKACIDESA